MTTQPINADPPTQKVKVAQPARKSVAVETPEPEPKRAANTTADTSVEGFLKSLGLEKYTITFQAEEVDMAALVQMTDEDLKALGIPMNVLLFMTYKIPLSCLLFLNSFYARMIFWRPKEEDNSRTRVKKLIFGVLATSGCCLLNLKTY
ncbi:putative methionine--tRNA ligase-like [Hibiscus syriacus]|uniref:Methionine--tRNA ligase-like n=1 Tax=Hibiscus syriacus TaxID=106335 RepID=A0A6A3ACD0_HIBSY|nr:putative methionine--tRNA ligase-like [Hibiscus syriacus]